MKTDIIKRLARIESLLAASKEVLTMDDMSSYTGYSKNYIYHLTSTRQIPFYKPTENKLIFKKSEIDKWLLKNRHASNDEVRARAAAYRAR